MNTDSEVDSFAPAIGMTFWDRWGDMHTVQEACAGKIGSWLCALHPKADTHNNISATSHAYFGGRHCMVWMCADHGAERP